MDIGGNIYPTEGFIVAKNFTRDIDVRFGLNGILWGKTCYFPYEKIDKGHWAVVKIELTEDLIQTDYRYNRYKFSNGFVVYTGSLRFAADYILEHKNDSDFGEEGGWLQPEEIAGSQQWMQDHALV